MHCHLNNASVKNLAVFSLEDLITFGTMIENSTAPVTKFTIYITSAKGTFALKISNKQDFINSKNKIVLANNAFEDAYRKKINGNKNGTIQSNAFLNFLKEKNILGVELYKSNSNFENWTKLTLNEDGTTNYNSGC